MLETFIIKGYTSENADFSFKYATDSIRCGGAIKRALLSNLKKGTEWYTAILECEMYQLSPAEEREDLRDNDSQRVWVIEAMPEGGDDDTETDAYMLTIDPA